MTVIHDLGANKRMRTWELGHNVEHLGELLLDMPSRSMQGDKHRSLTIHEPFSATENELEQSRWDVIQQKEEDTE